jgi:hypothetical protein
MQKWEQWEAKTVTPEQEGTGEYSGGWQRGRMYARAGNAFCDAARTTSWQLIELGRLINERDVVDALRPLDNTLRCKQGSPTATAAERKAFLGDWERHRSELVAAARNGVDACFKKFGGTPPRVHTPSTWVTLE